MLALFQLTKLFYFVQSHVVGELAALVVLLQKRAAILDHQLEICQQLSEAEFVEPLLFGEQLLQIKTDRLECVEKDYLQGADEVRPHPPVSLGLEDAAILVEQSQVISQAQVLNILWELVEEKRQVG